MKDQTSEVTFRIVDPNGREKKTVFKLFWKNYFGKENLNSKTLLVTTSPKNDRGIKFLVWENIACYVIENRPKANSPDGKTVASILKNDGAIRKIEYFSAEGALLNTQWIDLKG